MNLSFTRSPNRRERALFLPVFAIGILLTAVFIASCGDEGDTAEEPTGTTDILQPTTPTSETQPLPIVEEPPDGGVIEEIEEVVVEPEEPRVSFKGDIQPILAERCSIPGCHAAPGAGGLDLTEYDTFKQGGNGGSAFVDGAVDGSLCRKRLNGGGMPPIPPPLDADQVQLFIDWIDEGAENN